MRWLKRLFRIYTPAADPCLEALPFMRIGAALDRLVHGRSSALDVMIISAFGSVPELISGYIQTISPTHRAQEILSLATFEVACYRFVRMDSVTALRCPHMPDLREEVMNAFSEIFKDWRNTQPGFETARDSRVEYYAGLVRSGDLMPYHQRLVQNLHSAFKGNPLKEDQWTNPPVNMDAFKDLNFKMHLMDWEKRCLEKDATMVKMWAEFD